MAAVLLFAMAVPFNVTADESVTAVKDAVSDLSGVFKLFNGTWKKTRQWRKLKDGLLTFDAAAQQITCRYGRFGKVTLKVTGVKVDKDTGVTRYTLDVAGRPGKGKLTVLHFSSKTIYLGQSGLGKLLLWGTYHPRG